MTSGWRSPYRRLRGIDQMYLALETPDTPMHFGALVVLGGDGLRRSGRLRLAEIRAQLDARSLATPGLRRVVHRTTALEGAPLWVDDATFDIGRHVREVELPPPLDEDGLLRFAERLMAPLLDRSQPLWRLWLITGLPAGRIAALFVVHHAMADGMAAMRLARSLLGAPLADGSVAVDAPSLEPRARTGPPLRHDLLVRDNAHAILAGAAAFARLSTWQPVAEAVRSFRAGWATTRDGTPISLNGRVGPRRRTVAMRLEPRDVRRIARANHVGVNDVILGLVAGGLRAMLLARGEAVERARPRAGIAVALPPSARGDAGNHFGSYVVPLALHAADPRERLAAICAERARATRTQAVTGVTGVRVWAARFGPTRWLMGRQRYINLMDTYVPGPPSRIDLLGVPVLDLVPIQPLGRNVGLTVSGSSYAGCLTLAVRADPTLFPDLDVLVAAMEHDWRTLRASISSGQDRRPDATA